MVVDFLKHPTQNAVDMLILSVTHRDAIATITNKHLHNVHLWVQWYPEHRPAIEAWLAVRNQEASERAREVLEYVRDRFDLDDPDLDLEALNSCIEDWNKDNPNNFVEFDRNW